MRGPESPAPRSGWRRAAGWLRLAAFFATLSLAAIVVRVLGYPAPVPSFVAAGLDWFVEPGLTVWWITLGGLFEGYPSTRAGYAATLVGNVTFWLAISVLVGRVWRLVSGRHPGA